MLIFNNACSREAQDCFLGEPELKDTVMPIEHLKVRTAQGYQIWETLAPLGDEPKTELIMKWGGEKARESASCRAAHVRNFHCVLFSTFRQKIPSSHGEECEIGGCNWDAAGMRSSPGTTRRSGLAVWQGLELHSVLGGTGCGGVCMALLRGVGEMCRSRKIPQIASEQHAKEDFKIIDDLRRGRKIKSASFRKVNAHTGAKCEKKEESHNHRMQWHLRVSASGNRQRQTGEESSEVSLSFLPGDYDDVQQTREVKKKENAMLSTLKTALIVPLLKSFAGSTHIPDSQPTPTPHLPSSATLCCSAGSSTILFYRASWSNLSIISQYLHSGEVI